MSSSRNGIIICCLTLAWAWLTHAALHAEEVRRTQDAKLDFARDIRPILANHCWTCHGPDEKTREAELRLDSREGALARRGARKPAIVPGNPDASPLILRTEAVKSSKLMPPPDAKKPLSEQQKALLRRWVEQGAGYALHWAFAPPRRPSLPAVKNRSWVRNAIDAFVLARLEQEGLQPSAEAGRETLLRRVTLDLTGLPPTLEERNAYLADTSPGAYEKVIERLLASPRHAERMAMHWLDAARYADTNGYNNDEERTMWPWRDWVIDAFGRNLPFDQFVTEQLAGDLLQNPTLSQRIATGFNRNHVLTTEGGVIEDEYRVEYVADRVHTTATVFLGLSLQCGRCHDHKYDPVTQREYYQFFAYFNNLPDRSVGYNKGGAAEPFVKMHTADQQMELARLAKRGAELVRLLKKSEEKADAGMARWEKSLSRAEIENLKPMGLTAHFPLDETAGNRASDAVLPSQAGKVLGKAAWTKGKVGGALEFDGNSYIDGGQVAAFDSGDKFSLAIWVFPTTIETVAVLSKMDDANAYRGYDLLLEGGKVVAHLIHRWSDDAVKVAAQQAMSLNAWHYVVMTYDGSKKAAGVKVYVDGKLQALRIVNDNLKGTLHTDKPLHIGKRQQSLPFKGKLDEVQFYAVELSAGDAERMSAGQTPANAADLLTIPAAQRTEAQRAQLRQYYLRIIDTEFRRWTAERANLERRKAEIDSQMVAVMVMQEMPTPRKTQLLKRGQYDQPGEEVSPSVPSILPALPPGVPANRLGLARWLTQSGHPLTARVAVNRWWELYFGIGLVETAEDFGIQGSLPSHPELLDWLAVEFTQGPASRGREPPEERWSIKHLHRLIVTSSTYRQSSRITPALLERDPRNRLLARAPRFRMPAETVRDNALAVSGLLRERIGGPSVKPYQPEGLWEDVSVERRYKYVADQGDGLHRRSMYTYWRRTCPHPGMTTFDAPDRETCVIRRARTNTPLQALVLMNDPTYLEAARKFAERIIAQGGATGEARLNLAFELALSRRPQDLERRILAQVYQQARERYRQDPQAAKKFLTVGASKETQGLDDAELASWMTVASMILNLDEAITKN